MTEAPSAVEARLAELGLSLPSVVPPVAAYVPAVRTGDYIYVSGQLPMVSGAMPASGKVGEGEDLVSPEAAKELAGYSALNAIAAATAVLGAGEALVGVVKVVGFVAGAPGFIGIPTVINGASELFGSVFGEAGRHARSAVGVAQLPLDASVEVEAIFLVGAV
ncbi:RidA family protein [Naasia lichenicola]|uniref:RidA family protein n=1 Tax=Naasia lichenicola TaxID=2565933 RepID=A0A4S4FN48_9MICO|nr:RidA family protein [Naasia lichenicola]THG30895.1 RidA family protein [Naasia lichenicola]